MGIKVRLDTYALSAGKIAQVIVAGILGTNLLSRFHCLLCPEMLDQLGLQSQIGFSDELFL